MQERELEAAKRKILALSSKTIENGCTENEFFAASKMIGTLLDRFNLTMDEVTVRQEKCVTHEFDTESKHRSVSFSTAQAVAKFCQVRCWQNRTRYIGGIRLMFFGLEPDVQMAVYLSGLIKSAANRAVDEFKQTDVYKMSAYKRRQTFSFYNGMAARISERLDEMTIERLVAEKKAADYHAEQLKERMLGMSDEAAAKVAKQTTGTAMISLAKKDFVDEQLKLHGPKLYKVQNKSKANAIGGRTAGADAGSKVNLSRPLAHNGYGSTLLLS
jgi:hypothetical protein